MTTKTPPWFPTDEELSRSRALLAELEAHERVARGARAAQSRAMAGLMRIAVAQGRRVVLRPGTAGSSDDLPVRSMAAEVALVQGVSRFRAKADLSDAYLLHEMFPATTALLESTEINRHQAKAVTDHGTSLHDDDLRAEYERQALALLTETETMSLSGFRTECKRIAQALDPITAETQATVERRSRRVFTTVLTENLAELHVISDAATVLGMEDRITSMGTAAMREAARVHREAVDAAGESDPGIEPDPRGLGEFCADIAADLILTGRPTAHVVTDATGKNALDAIHATIQVTIPARTLTGLSDEAAFLAGHGPVDADTARRLAAAAPRWDRVFREPGTGALLTTDSYKPTADQRRFLRARDEHCRFPGCDRPFHRSDIDHTIEWAEGGRTDVENLGALCRHHHVLRHHSPWKVKQRAAGVYEWTSPTGRAYEARPAPTVRFVDSERLAHGLIETNDCSEPAPF